MARGATTERRLALLSALALSALAVLAAAAQPGAGVRLTGGRAHADLDGDRVFDDLEARAGALAADDTLDVIVRLREAATRSRVERLEALAGEFAVERRFTVLRGFAARVTKAQLAALARDPSVVRVEPVVSVQGLNDKAQASFGVAKARLDVQTLDGDRDGKPASYSKDDVVVAVVDSGVDATHPDLDDGKVIHFKDAVKEPPDGVPYDDNGHGTHVAGIVAGTGDANPLYRGVAPGAAIVAVKVLDRLLNGDAINVIEGLEWVYHNVDDFNIRVVNLSFEAASGCSGSDSLVDIVNKLVNDKGVLVTVAAGNGGPSTCSIGSPALARDALTVGAMADTGEGGFRPARFSSRGPTRDGRIKPDLLAPGVAITSACSPPPACITLRYSERSGTSMAAPFAAGVGVLMLDANATLTGAQLKALLTQSAADWGRGGDNVDPAGRGPDIDYGAGRLDAYAALAAAGAPLTSPPPVPAHELRHGTLNGAGASADHRIVVTSTDFPLAVTALAPGNGGLDVDLALYDPAASQVASSTIAGRQDDLSIQPPAAGAYMLRVTSKTGAGHYSLDISGTVASPPVNEAPPNISGEARERSALSAQPGRWSGATPMSFDYQWVRCDGQGNGCVGIAGATGPTYSPGGADIDSTLRAVVTGSNAAGSAAATTAPSGAVAPLAAANTASPALAGRARIGNTLTALPGEWRSSQALAFAYQWRRCATAGGCEAIAGATGSTYRLRTADAGDRVGVVVTATNGGGSASAASPTVLVEADAPRPSGLPKITGRARVGSRLRASRGHWLATPPLRYSWRWSRCNRAGHHCVPLRRPRSRTYVLRRADAGHRLRVRVFADNRRLPGGALVSTVSRATAVVRR